MCSLCDVLFRFGFGHWVQSMFFQILHLKEWVGGFSPFLCEVTNKQQGGYSCLVISRFCSSCTKAFRAMRQVPTVHESSFNESADSFVAMLNQSGEDDLLSLADEHSDALDFSEVSFVGTADDSQALGQASSQDPKQVGTTCQGVGGASSVASNSDPRIDFSNVLQSALQSLTSKPVRNVWENGVWGCIFGNDNLMQAWNSTGFQFYRPQQTLGIPANSDGEPQQMSKKLIRLSEDYHDVVKFKSDATCQEQCESGWQETISSCGSQWLHVGIIVFTLSN